MGTEGVTVKSAISMSTKAIEMSTWVRDVLTNMKINKIRHNVELLRKRRRCKMMLTRNDVIACLSIAGLCGPYSIVFQPR